MRKKTHIEFLSEMESINSNISFLDEYDGDRIKLRCVCKICGNQWMASPGHLLRGRGCPSCAIKKQAQSKRKTQAQVLSELSERNPGVTVIGLYKGADVPIEVKCKKCGYIWTPIPNSLLRGTGCPSCAGNQKRTHEQFVDQLHKIDSSIEVLGKYINTDTKIEVKCKNCGKTWHSTPNNLLDGHGCARCAGRKSQQEFLEDLSKVNPDIEVLGKYVDFKTHVAVRCKVCGYEWKSRPSQLLSGHGCHKCGIKKQADMLRKSQEQFEAELTKINPNILVKGKYINNMTPIEVECKKCGNEWKGIPGSLLVGQGCPRCKSYLHTSFPEQTIFYYIHNAFPEAISGYKELFDNGMEIDIFIPSMRLGIEYDGRAWHAGNESYKREIKKYTLCHENDIKLVRIKEEKQKRDSETADQIVYTGESLEETLCKVADLLGVIFDINIERDRDEIFEQYKSLDPNEEFIQKLGIVNSDVIPLSRYTLSSNKIKCKCKKCGYEWMVTPNKLLSGRGCPKCSGKMKKDTEQFGAELKKVNPSIELVGEYSNASSPVKVRCKKCFHEWSPVASSLLVGNGCPKCAHRITLSHGQFTKELERINADIEVLGEYKTKKTPILVKCKKCGREWLATPDNLLRNHGCAKCAKVLKRTTEDFVKELAKVNERFIVLGEYKNARTKITVVCKDCGYERHATPDSLLRGLRCPNCDK